MSIAFRVDASIQIGSGHVMRCLTLANALREQGVICGFICREHPGNLLNFIREQGFYVIALPMPLIKLDDNKNEIEQLDHTAWLGQQWELDALETLQAIGDDSLDWIIVDHYAIDARWENQMRIISKRIMVIDDLADRFHDCDLLLDQNLGRVATDYRSLIPFEAKILVGPQYALLRPEFSELRSKNISRRQNEDISHIFIAMGGMDKENFTEAILSVLDRSVLPDHTTVSAVLGSQAPWLGRVQIMAKSMRLRTNILVNVANIGSIMMDCNFAIGAAGGTAWERCCLGVPTLILAIAENQVSGALALQKSGAAIVVNNMLDLELIINKKLLSPGGKKILEKLSFSASSITDGTGTSKILQYLAP